MVLVYSSTRRRSFCCLTVSLGRRPCCEPARHVQDPRGAQVPLYNGAERRASAVSPQAQQLRAGIARRARLGHPIAALRRGADRHHDAGNGTICSGKCDSPTPISTGWL